MRDNAFAERFVGRLRRECLDHMLILSHYDISTDTPDRHRLCIAFNDLALTI